MTQNRPDPIWLWRTMSDFGQTDPVRKQAGVQESSGEVLANANSEPVWIVGRQWDPAYLQGERCWGLSSSDIDLIFSQSVHRFPAYCASMCRPRRCHLRAWLTKFSSAIYTSRCFSLLRSTVFTEVSSVKTEPSPKQFFSFFSVVAQKDCV